MPGAGNQQPSSQPSKGGEQHYQHKSAVGHPRKRVCSPPPVHRGRLSRPSTRAASPPVTACPVYTILAALHCCCASDGTLHDMAQKHAPLTLSLRPIVLGHTALHYSIILLRRQSASMRSQQPDSTCHAPSQGLANHPLCLFDSRLRGLL